MSIQKFEQYQKIINRKKSELAEINAELKLIKENAIKEFGTAEVAKLKQILEQHKTTLKEAEEEIVDLEEDIEELLSELEDE